MAATASRTIQQLQVLVLAKAQKVQNDKFKNYTKKCYSKYSYIVNM
jgi:hypothetical protein